MNHKKFNVEDRLYQIGSVFFFLILIFGFLFFTYWKKAVYLQPCIVYQTTGLYCPGCGTTRAVVAFWRGNIIKSIYYHPIVLYGTIVYVSFMSSQTFARITKFRYTKGMQFHEVYLYIALIILIISMVVKNILKFYFHILLV